MRKNLGILVAIVALTLVLDQWTKSLVRAGMQVGDSFPVIPGLLNLTYVRNLGAAFGMFQGNTWVFVACAVLISTIIIGYVTFSKHTTTFETVSLALIVAGALGNLIDRITSVHVTDFFEFAFIDFPVFNVADCAITVGTVLFLVWVLFLSERQARDAGDSASAAPASTERDDA